MTTPLITDFQTLVSAASRFGHPVPTFDDGFGPLWIHRDSMGITGIVRAQTWEDAYAICEDEFMAECGLSVEELRKEYSFRYDHVKMVGDRMGSIWQATEQDYEDGKLRPGVEFIRWETIKTPTDDEDAWMENERFQEAYGWRFSGANPTDTMGHGIYSKDLNGDALELLTRDLLERLEITLEITNE
jgi:hypothetical protein